MPDVKQLLINELAEAKKTYSTLEDIEIQISLYKDELMTDIQAMEMLIKRQEDKKFDQVNSALEFVMSDLMKYAGKVKKESAKVDNLKLVKDKVKQSDSLIKSGRVNNEYLSRLVVAIMQKYPNTVFTNSEIAAHLVSAHPELKTLWKNPSAAVNYIMSLLTREVNKVGAGQYILKSEG